MPELKLPEVIADESALDELLSRPSAQLVSFIRTLDSPLVLLGAGGKMGPTLAVLAKRAAQAAGHDLRVIAVSRFSDSAALAWLQNRGVETLRVDLLKREAYRSLPDSSHVIHLVGLKFGTQDNPSLTWAVNTLLPSWVAERYAAARLVVLSTGNVYPLVSVDGPGAGEDQPLTPFGEYANAAVARERIIEYLVRQNGNAAVLIRLNYAVELRYGVLLDIARKIDSGQPIDLTAGYFNCIWQGDANEMILRAFDLASCPPRAINVTGPERLSVRAVAAQLADALGRPARLTGVEAPTALLSDTGRMRQFLGLPATPSLDAIRWTAHWVKQAGRTLGKPTHFEEREGRY